MNILILGGTQFVGRHLAQEAIDRGHTVTLFHRGKTARGLFEGAQEVFGDRDGGLPALGGKSYDWVLDTCGYVPRVVAQSAAYFQDKASAYLFVSTISVYASFAEAGLVEGDPVAVIEDPETETVDGRTYGALKALCESRVLEHFQGRALLPRPGIIAGPYDPTDRFTYWVGQASGAADFIAPGPQQAPMQLIDARDLARCMMDWVEADRTGVYNTAGPMGGETFDSMIAACQRATGGGARPKWRDPQVLLDEGYEPNKDFPLWTPKADHAGIFQVDSSKAVAAGLQYRPLEETARDTWDWIQTWPEGREYKVGRRD